MKKLFLLMLALPLAACGKDDNDNDSFPGFEEPQITVVNSAPGTAGGQRFANLVPNTQQFALDHVMAVVKTLYANGSDANRAGIKKINLQITADYDGLAAKFGDAPEITIKYGVNALAALVQDDAEALAEIRGVIDHELTHAYQSQPKGTGYDYSGGAGTPYWAFIEGMADAVRPTIEPFSDGRVPMVGGYYKWLQGYSVTGFFLKWLKDNKDPNFLRKFNATGFSLNPWSWDAAMKSIFGDSVTTQSLWDEYQASFE